STGSTSFIQNNEVHDSRSTHGAIYVYNDNAFTGFGPITVTIQNNRVYAVTRGNGIQVGDDTSGQDAGTTGGGGSVLNNTVTGVTGTGKAGISVWTSRTVVTGNTATGNGIGLLAHG